MNHEPSNADLMHEYMHINTQGVNAPEFIRMDDNWAEGFRTYVLLRQVHIHSEGALS